jgi:hypothetical protein
MAYHEIVEHLEDVRAGRVDGADDGTVAIACQLEQDLNDARRALAVEARRGLVQEQNAGIGDQFHSYACGDAVVRREWC